MNSGWRPKPEPDGAVGTVPSDDEFEQAAAALRLERPLRHPRLRDAAAFLAADTPDLAQNALKQYLKEHPQDAESLNLMAEVKIRLKRNDLAENYLEQCLQLAPDFAAARFSYANVLLHLNKTSAALAQLEKLLDAQPRNPLFRKLKIAVLEWMGEFAQSIASCRGLLADYPDRPDVWVRYGHSLRGMGLQDECVAAYRKAIELDPSHAGAYWSLANLKTFRFAQDEIDGLQALLARSDVTADVRTCLHFALGKAYADMKLYAQSYQNYAKGNALYRLRIDDDPDILTEHVGLTKDVMTVEFFRQREGFGYGARDPVFIVGLPRSGSTLVEQILASHSAIEGGKELPDLLLLCRDLESRVAPLHGTHYPGVLRKLDASALRALGEQYLQSTRVYRKLGRPFFTDKMGANYLHIGMIHLILPNARIVDVRRHPMACCFSNFTQHFDKGQTYSYRQTDLGRSYRDYVDLMAHFDRVLPGKVLRVFYEQLVEDPETQIRRLLDYLELPFEEACLQFHKNDRFVTTVSSEQVRTPIFRDGLEQWRHYEQWLGPLKATLGPVLDAYPDAPAFEAGGS
ncbi:MAG TPA: sulfotransferase [Rhizomicrobium sp.]|jgi:tetratricopeptide (TPR) repeat protein|nr:sulfotransferase [Rhizomicrobium sp.]